MWNIIKVKIWFQHFKNDLDLQSLMASDTKDIEMQLTKHKRMYVSAINLISLSLFICVFIAKDLSM